MSRSQQTTSEEKAEDCDCQPEVVGDFKETALSGHNRAVAHMKLQHEKRPVQARRRENPRRQVGEVGVKSHHQPRNYCHLGAAGRRPCSL